MRFPFLIFLICTIQQVFGQSHYADSLTNLLDKNPGDSIKVELNIALGRHYTFQDSALANKHFMEAIALMNAISHEMRVKVIREKAVFLRQTQRKNESLTFLGQFKNSDLIETPFNHYIFNEMGITYYQMGIPDSAQKYFLKGLQITQESHLAEREGVLTMNLGNVQYMKSQLDSALFFYNLAQDIFQKTGSSERLAKLFIIKVIIYQNQKNLSKAQEALKQALQVKFSDKLEMYDHKANVYNMKASLDFLQNDYPEALAHIDSSIFYFNHLGAQEKIVAIKRLKGNVLLKKGDVGAAHEMFFEILNFQEANQSPYEHASVLMDLGNAFALSGNYNDAKDYYSQALHYAHSNKLNPIIERLYTYLGMALLETGEPDSAYHYLILAKSNNVETRNQVYQYLTHYFLWESKLDSAQHYVDLILNYPENESIPSLYNGALVNQANIYFQNGKYEPASRILNQIIDKPDEINSLKVLREAHYLLYALSEKTGAHKNALNHYKEYQHLKDSLHNLGNISKGIAMKVSRTYEKQMLKDSLIYLEKENDALKEKEKAEAKISEQRIYIYTAGIITVLLVGIVGIIYRNNIKVRNKNTIINKQKDEIDRSLAEKEVLLKEIHHRVKNNLQTISSLLNLQSQYLDKSAQAAVEEGRNRVKSMALIHQRLYQGTDLTSIQFSDYVKQLAENLFSTYHVGENKISLSLDIDPIGLDIDTAIPLGLILNELITNALKHAFPNNQEGNITVSLKEVDQKLLLTISDNGIGIQKNATESFGTTLINALTNRLQGTINQRTDPGTEIKIEIKNYKLAS